MGLSPEGVRAEGRGPCELLVSWDVSVEHGRDLRSLMRFVPIKSCSKSIPAKLSVVGHENRHQARI